MGRPPIRTTMLRESNEAPQKKVRLRKNASQRSVLDIDPDILSMLDADGISLNWVVDSILGQPAQAARSAFEVNAWEPVTPDMWNGLFDGVYTKKGHRGEINYEGLVLMWRPKELTEEAMAEENMARYNAIAAQQNMLKTGQLPNFPAGFEPDHPAAVSKNILTRTIKPPMDVPKD